MPNPNPTKTSWKPGQSGNPSGRPRGDHKIQELARGHGPTALDVLVKIATEGQSEGARVSAAIALLDRGYGRPPQLNTNDPGALRRAVDLSDDELASIIAAGSSDDPAEAPDDPPKPH